MSLLARQNSFAQGTYTLLHNFFGGVGSQVEGALTEVKPGVFVGTAINLYQITSTGVYTNLTPYEQSNNLSGNLFPASNGLLYGSSNKVFDTTVSGQVAVLQSVNGPGGLIEAADGKLYGIYNTGLSYPQGAPYQFYELTLAGALTPLGSAQFPPTVLYGQLIQAKDGNFYGTDQLSEESSNAYVNVFKLTPTGTYSYLFTSGAVADGQLPNGPLVAKGNYLFGSAACGELSGFSYGCAQGYGVVFAVSLQGDYTVLYTFQNGSDGAFPSALILASDGNLYGQSMLESGQEQLFRLSPNGQSFSVVAQYPAGAPAGYLTQGSDGKIYGAGMPNNTYPFGNVFSVDLGLPAPPPVVTNFSPKSGDAGTKVLISGNQLLGITGVSFNGIPAAHISSKGVYYVYATVPAGASTGPITVTTANGSTTTRQSFTVTTAGPEGIALPSPETVTTEQ